MVFPGYARPSGPDPVNPQDLATKNYVDTKPFFSITGVSAPTLCASTATVQITAWSGTPVVRGAGSWNGSAYTVGLAGIYRVKYSHGWNLATAFTTDTQFSNMIYRNGAELARASMYLVTLTAGVALAVPAADRAVLCNVGDTFTFYVTQGSSVSESFWLPNCNVEVFYVQP